MKIKNVLYDMVVEEVQNKKLINGLLEKWIVENGGLTVPDVEKIYNDFQRIKNGLSTERPTPAIVSFLYRFDGKHGYTKFEPANLKDITKYTYKQIKSLISEYIDDDNPELEDNLNGVFDGKDNQTTPEKVQASKSLWTNPHTALIDTNGLRVYDIPNQKTSIAFGYYLEQVNGNFDGDKNSYWCTTWRGNGQYMTNQWSNKRADGRSFYYVIDDNKNPETDPYYLCALQKIKGRDIYIITPLTNNDDSKYPWSDVIEHYPQLKDYKNLLVDKPYSTQELEEKSIAGQITEAPRSPYEFKRVSKGYKKVFINNMNDIKRAESWKSMDTSLRNLYIVITTENNIKNRFSNFELLQEIKKVGNEFTLLDNRIKKLGHPEGVSFIVDELLKTEFVTLRSSIDKQYLRIKKSKENDLCGIYDTRKLSFVTDSGIDYGPSYTVKTNVFKDEENNQYLIEIFENGAHSFYCIIPRKDNPKYGGYIMSKQKFDELNIDLSAHKGKFDPTTDVDINEIKKGV